jgi:antitoxin component of RelBE/YafQ-DinJ toxin-antitoxin module
VKADATKTLAAMGMSVSDAARMLLVRVTAEKALPLENNLIRGAQFKRDGKLAERRGKDLPKLRELIPLLVESVVLAAALQGPCS